MDFFRNFDFRPFSGRISANECRETLSEPFLARNRHFRANLRKFFFGPLFKAWTLGAGLKGGFKGLCLKKALKEARKIFFSDFAESGAIGPNLG